MKEIVGVLEILQNSWPDASCELYHQTPFQLLVSVILSAQATDKSVNRCMEPLYRDGVGLEEILLMGESGFLSRIKSIGLAPTKSKNVLGMCRQLKDEHGGLVPNTRKKLESLPGVGPKTASVVLGECFGHPTLAVDTHVFRVTKRLGFHVENSPNKAEGVLTNLIPDTWLPKAHHLFIFHGRYQCSARKPSCSTCPLKKVCPSRLE